MQDEDIQERLNICDFDADYKASHHLIIVKWIMAGAPHGYNTSKHASQLMCSKCFKLFDFQAIQDFPGARQCKNSETS